MSSSDDVRYLAQVRKYLFCPRKDKKRLTEKCRAFLDGYRQENPDAQYDDVVSNFGPPSDFAGVLIAEACPDMLQDLQTQYMKRQKLWLRVAVCLGILAFAVLLVAILCYYFYEPAYFVKTVTTF